LRLRTAELRWIAAASAPLFERDPATHRPAREPGASTLARQRLDRWSALVGGPARLARRLALAGVDVDAALAALGPVRLRRHAPTPTWTCLLAEACAADPPPSAATPGGPDAARRRDTGAAPSTAPFAAALGPFVACAADRLARRAPGGAAALSAGAQEALLEQLRGRLAAIAGRVLLSTFAARRGPLADPSERVAHDEFVRDVARGGWPGLLLAHPVLARLLADATGQWVAATARFVGDLARDRPALASRGLIGPASGRVVGVRSPPATTRGGGRSVMLLAFESGDEVVYKPRDLDLDDVFVRLLTWLSARAPAIDLGGLPVLTRGDHGWMTLALAAPCRDGAAARRFHRRGGALLCLAGLLGSRDLHAANLIAEGEHPRVVDLEMLVDPDLGQATPPLSRTGLLPCTATGADEGADMSGLCGLGGRAMSVSIGEWHDPGTDAVRYAITRARTPVFANAPVLAGARVDARSHADEVLAGFADAYAALLACRAALAADDGPLAPLRGCRVAVTPRPPQIYATLLEHLLHPRHLGDGASRTVELERLAAPLPLVGATDAGLLRDEHAALERMDVPRFTRRAARSLPGIAARLDRMGPLDLSARLDEIRRALTPPALDVRAADSNDAAPGTGR